MDADATSYPNSSFTLIFSVVALLGVIPLAWRYNTILCPSTYVLVLGLFVAPLKAGAAAALAARIKIGAAIMTALEYLLRLKFMVCSQ